MSTRADADAPSITFAPVSVEDGPALTALFERACAGCFCRYWHFEGDKNAWLDRLAHAPERNAQELLADLNTSESAPLGVVARALHPSRAEPSGSAIVGWMKLTSADRVPKLYEQRVYRRLPCFDGDRSRIFTIGCFLVDPAERRRKIAAGLLVTGIELARSRGASAIEAFPRRAELLGDEERWTGPLELFLQHGFEIVHEVAQYPVLRLSI